MYCYPNGLSEWSSLQAKCNHFPISRGELHPMQYAGCGENAKAPAKGSKAAEQRRVRGGMLAHVSLPSVHTRGFAIGDAPEAAAITFASGTDLVVDSVEGGLRTRENPEIMERMLSRILEYARAEGMKRALMSSSAHNETPRASVELAKRSGAPFSPT